MKAFSLFFGFLYVVPCCVLSYSTFTNIGSDEVRYPQESVAGQAVTVNTSTTLERAKDDQDGFGNVNEQAMGSVSERPL